MSALESTERITELTVKQALQHEVMCTWWAAEVAGDDLAGFADRLGVDAYTAAAWLTGTQLPDAGSLMRAQLSVGHLRGMGYLYERYIAARDGDTL